MPPRYTDPIGTATTNQPKYATAITPSNTTDLANVTNALYVGTSGNVQVLFEGDTVPVVLKGVVAGNFYPFHIKRVYVTNTTAADLVALY